MRNLNIIAHCCLKSVDNQPSVYTGCLCCKPSKRSDGSYWGKSTSFSKPYTLKRTVLSAIPRTAETDMQDSLTLQDNASNVSEDFNLQAPVNCKTVKFDP